MPLSVCIQFSAICLLAMTESSTPAESESMRSFARSLPMALLKARESVMVRFRPMLRAHGITEQQWRVLRPMEMAQMTFISMPSLSRLLKTLEVRTLIQRGRLADDLRGSEFSLTDAGNTLVQEIAPSSEATYTEIESLMGHADVEQLYQVLAKVVQRLGEPSSIEVE